MALLSDDQLHFLMSQGIPLSQVFDATGLTRSQYKEKMRELGMLVALGTTPCTAGGHTLRTRSGHCIQCGTHNLAFLKRFEEPGFVYVLTSPTKRLVKVGTTGEVQQRLKSLRGYGYGGASDWELSFSLYSEKAGRVECQVHERLAQWRVHAKYWRDGASVDCQELFFMRRCSGC